MKPLARCPNKKKTTDVTCNAYTWNIKVQYKPDTNVVKTSV